MKKIDKKMSREIKFRVWDVETQKYRTDCRLKDVFGTVTGNPATVFVDTINTAGAVEQYTGLKDKNGKEIYEGDIVNKGYLNYKVFDEIGEVQLGILSDSDGYSHFEILGWKAGDNSLFDVCEECEIIGNIHENPELLKECEK